jgi:hypothetical protein
MKKKTREQFIKEAQDIHGNKYDYSEVEYKNTETKVKIKCNEIGHGIFEQSPKLHIKGSGCPICYGTILKTTDQFIKEAQEIHRNKYDYTKVNYKNMKNKVIITCKEINHGDFEQISSNHLRGAGCPRCSETKKKTKDDFIKEAQEIHRDKYDYNKVKYTNNKTKVIITCKEINHGDFEQIPNSHLLGHGCPKCSSITVSNKLRDTLENFIQKAKIMHKDNYDYSKVKYVNSQTKVIIICKTHGPFEALPSNHLNGTNCNECSIIIKGNKLRKSKEDFIKEAQEKHENKYDYAKVEYINTDTKVIITCKEINHGDFKQSPDSHLQGHGCPICARKENANKLRDTLEIFIKKAKVIHKDNYDYSKVRYVNSQTKVIIICKEHGEFEQKPNVHLNGSGCPKCTISMQYSRNSILWLDYIANKNNIDIIHAENDGEFKLPNSNYSCDGYCKETNTIYEFQGCYWHGCKTCYENIDKNNLVKKNTFEERYLKTQKKKQWCIDNGYNYVEIWECEWDNLPEYELIIKNKDNTYKIVNKYSWKDMFEKLKQFIKDKNRIPNRSSNDNEEKDLQSWIQKQNKNYKEKKDNMKDIQNRKDWQYFISEYDKYKTNRQLKEDEAWYKQFETIQSIIEYNIKNVVFTNIKDKLLKWISKQNINYKDNKESMKDTQKRIQWEKFIKKYEEYKMLKEEQIFQEYLKEVKNFIFNTNKKPSDKSKDKNEKKNSSMDI